MSPIRAVIFDMGGVLLRTADRGPRTRLAERYGLTYEQMEALVFDSETATQCTVGKITTSEFWKAVCKRLNEPVERSQELSQAFFGGDMLDMQLVAFIRSLRPRYRTALLSNAWDNLRNLLEENWKILDAFDEVFISAEMGMSKPDERIFQAVMQKLGLEAGEIIFVDDFPKNIEAAARLGLHAVRFIDTQQAIADVEAILHQD